MDNMVVQILGIDLFEKMKSIWTIKNIVYIYFSNILYLTLNETSQIP